MAQRSNRERAAIVVLACGALTTLATSRANDPQIVDEISLELEAGERVHLVVRASRSAVRHAERASIQTTNGARIDLVPDDESLRDQNLGSLGDPEALCPGEGDCDLGLEVENIEDSATTARITVSFLVQGDSAFLFPSNREFPEDATLEILVE
ncbi:MAG: hypothetical protein J0L92_04300 [Deltaproteobacteria bacterium]|nr:hypothetical protein [Deltaproteobacteria bacterium]